MSPKGGSTRRVIIYTLITMVYVFFLFPIAWIMMTSFKDTGASEAYPPLFFFQPIKESYELLLLGNIGESGIPSFVLAILNSVVIALGSTLLGLALALPTAYSLARYKSKVNSQLGLWILSQKMMPALIFVIPFYLLFRNLLLLDTHLAVILVHTAFNMPLAVWLMKSFIEEIPPDLDESARVDGCSELGAFTRVVLPLTKPGLVTAAIFLVIFSWNELPFALVLTNVKAQTIPVFLTQYTLYHHANWNLVAAGVTIAIIPIIVFAFIVSKHLVRGLTLGSVKE